MVGVQVGNFHVTKELGKGGMGTVYAGQDVSTGQVVALKSLNKEYMKSKELRDRFVREAQAMARLQHPNIVQFLGWVDDPAQGWFIAMEFVKGEDVEKLIERMGLIPPAMAIDIFLPVLDALAYAHAQGVIHRDIKPSNIMKLESGIVKVLDFGTAKLVDQSAMTRLGQQIGTSVYMPLEQLLGQPINYTADIYALGVTLYEMVTGKLPYYSEDQFQLVQYLMSNVPAPPSAVYPPTPKGVDAVVMRAMQRDPQSRFQSALEMKAALMQVRSSLGAGGASEVAQAPTATLTPEQVANAQARAAHVQTQKKGCMGALLLAAGAVAGLSTLAAAVALAITRLF
jgi:serine/threonine-protein kinase